MPNGRALGGHSHDYKRNGTSTLFAAFEVATGKVTAAHKKRRRRRALDFMNDIVAAWPDTAIHVVLDNLNTHKPRKTLAKAASERDLPLHADPGLMAQSGGDLVLDPAGEVPVRQILTSVKQLRDHTTIHRRLQRQGQALRLDQVRSSSEPSQSPVRGPIIPEVLARQGASIRCRRSHSFASELTARHLVAVGRRPQLRSKRQAVVAGGSSHRRPQASNPIH